jgi:hypothetical protein
MTKNYLKWLRKKRVECCDVDDATYSDADCRSSVPLGNTHPSSGNSSYRLYLDTIVK